MCREREPEADWITYLDGDLYFFASPEAVYGELAEATVAIIPHRYAPNLTRRACSGPTMSDGLASATIRMVLPSSDGGGNRCIEWCHDHVDGERYADQGYLDSFSRRSTRVKSVDNVGANLAPWNIGNYRIDFRDGRVMIDAIHPLIFFHFQGLRKGLRWFIFNSHRIFGAPFSRDIREHIYRPYVDELLAIEKITAPMLEVHGKPHPRRDRIPSRAGCEMSVFASFQLLDIVSRRAFLVLRGTAY